MSGGSLSADYFQKKYSKNADPWRFTRSRYEAAKYATTIATLGTRRYRSGFEVGCSIGVLTEDIAARCDRLLAVDVVDAALAATKRRCKRYGERVDIRYMDAPKVLPDESFDLIVLSEVAYYWSIDGLDRMIEWSETHLVTGAVILVHWTGPTDYPLTADQVHDHFRERTSFACYRDERHPFYRITALRAR
jgi:precorrin-6B methylase 2